MNPPHLPEALVGRTLRTRYRLDAVLAAGAMGTVYRAFDVVTMLEVAVKVLHPEWTAVESVRARFAREARLLTDFDDPSLVRVWDAEIEEDGLCFMVMELLEGETLADLIGRRGPVLGIAALADLRSVVAGIVTGLEAVHERGVIHGDLKPANVFLRGDGRVTLLDFGLAKVVGAVRLTRTGEITGTPAYLAPELITGGSAPDLRIDVYALGVVLYQLVSCATPFPKKHPGQWLADIVGGHAVPLLTRCPQLPESLEALIQHAMAPRREARLPTPRAVLEGFDAVLLSLR